MNMNFIENKELIKRLLFGSAVSFIRPWAGCENKDFGYLAEFVSEDELIVKLNDDDLRTFYLLVAEAL